MLGVFFWPAHFFGTFLNMRHELHLRTMCSIVLYIGIHVLNAQPYLAATIAQNNLSFSASPSITDEYDLGARGALEFGLWSTSASGLFVTQPYMEVAFDRYSSKTRIASASGIAYAHDDFKRLELSLGSMFMLSMGKVHIGAGAQMSYQVLWQQFELDGEISDPITLEFVSTRPMSEDRISAGLRGEVKFQVHQYDSGRILIKAYYLRRILTDDAGGVAALHRERGQKWYSMGGGVVHVF